MTTIHFTSKSGCGEVYDAASITSNILFKTKLDLQHFPSAWRVCRDCQENYIQPPATTCQPGILQVASQCDCSHNCLKDCWVIQIYAICLKHNAIMWSVIMWSVSNWLLIYHLSQITFILFDEVFGGLLDIAAIKLQSLVKCW